MTVANTTARTSATGTAAAGQEISFSFPINATSDLVVKTRVTTTGVEASLSETTDYTVSISGDTGGTVTLVDALAATYTVHVIRKGPRTQSLDLVAGGAFNPENVEEGFDKLCRLVNDLYDKVSRCIQMPDTDAALDMELDSSVDRASNYLAFTAAGGVTVVASVAPTTATLTVYGESLVAVANEAAFKALTNLEAGTDIQAYSAKLLAIAALAVTNGNIIVGDGTTFVAESGATARTSLSVPADADVVKKDASVAYTGTGVGFTDEDDMLSDLPLAPPSEQSVRAFLYSIVTYGGDVLTHNGEVLTYV